MTNFFDSLYQGGSTFAKSALWNGSTGTPGIQTATSPNDTNIFGAPHGITFPYQIGLASTALASGIFFSASGATAGGTLTSTGALVSGGVATLDVPRAIRFTSSVDLSTNVFTIRGTDGYGQSQTWAGIGPTGNTFGNTGSFVDSLTTFKTITTASAVGASSTTAFAIGVSNTFGLPYRIANKGQVMGVFIDGGSATIPAVVTAGFTATGTPTASTADVRGTVAISTTVLPNDTRFFVVNMIQPVNNISSSFVDSKENTWGATPFSS